MIPRYARPEMTALWEPHSRFSIWLEIETHALDAMAKLGTVPAEAAKLSAKKAILTLSASMKSSARSSMM